MSAGSQSNSLVVIGVASETHCRRSTGKSTPLVRTTLLVSLRICISASLTPGSPRAKLSRLRKADDAPISMRKTTSMAVAFLFIGFVLGQCWDYFGFGLVILFDDSAKDEYSNKSRNVRKQA